MAELGQAPGLDSCPFLFQKYHTDLFAIQQEAGHLGGGGGGVYTLKSPISTPFSFCVHIQSHLVPEALCQIGKLMFF